MKKFSKCQSKISRTSYHLILCHGKKTSCASCNSTEESYKEIKFQIKKLKEIGLYCTLSLSPCLKVCHSGPILVVHPMGIWYHSCSPKVIKRIFNEHLLKNQIVEEFVLGKMNFAHDPIEVKPNNKTVSPLNAEYFLS